VVTADRAADLLSDALRTGGPDLLRFLERRIGGDEAPDALEEVMVTAWRRAADLPDDPEQVRMWLYGIARNVVLNARRAEGRRRGLTDRLRLHARPAEQPGADTGVEVRDAIDRLDPDLAEIVRLVHWDGFGLAEVGRLLGLPTTTVSSRYQRARGLLRAALAGEDASPGAVPARRAVAARPVPG
jgi:RNA polymerase sigma-70 factor (ECF subfamily)